MSGGQAPASERAPVIAVAGGGTGGHLYPALSIVEALRKRVPGLQTVFFCTDRPIDGQVLADRPASTIVPQRLRPLSAKPWRWPAIAADLLAATRACRARFRAERPLMVIGTGGLASVPAVRAGRQLHVPTVLLNPDAVPGKANRMLARSVDVVFAQWEDSRAHFAARTAVEVRGCAIRPAFAQADRTAGMAHFELDPRQRTLLVTGASQGARTLNEALLANLDLFEGDRGWQVLHLAGQRDFDAVREAYAGRAVAAKVLAYTNEMALALAAADLVLSRAGASTLAEITAVGKPAILMPYPFHRDQHQLANARCLERVGAARIVTDRVAVAENGPALRPVLEALLGDHALREQMAAGARSIGKPAAGGEIARRLLELAQVDA